MGIFTTDAYDEAQAKLEDNQALIAEKKAEVASATPIEPQPQVQPYVAPEETPASNLTDEDRLEYLQLADEEGIEISKINPEKFGADPAAFLIEQTFAKAKKAGWTNEEYKAVIDETLTKNGYDLKDFQEDEGQFVNNRFETGLANSLMEMYVGGKEVLGIEVSDTENAMNEQLFKEKKQREAYHKYAEATMEDQETAGGIKYQEMDSNFDIAGGLGEAAPSLVLGLGVGGVTAKAGMGLTKALTADMVAQQAISGMEYKGASDADTQAGTQLAFETAGNIAGFGIGKLLGGIGKKAATPAYAQAVNDMGQAKAADILETIKFAEDNGITILGHDIEPGTQYSQLMEAVAQNPVLSGKLKEVTTEDVGVITKYISDLKGGYNDVMQTDANMGQYITRVIDGQEEAFDTAIGKAYDDMDAMMANNPSAMTNETFTNWLDTVKTKVNTEDMTPKVRKHLQSTIDEYIADFQATGKSVNVSSMYNIMRDTISEAASLSKQVDKGSESKAYAQLAETFEKQFDVMADMAGKGNPALAETIGKAKSLYKERVEKFGYRKTGKSGKGTGFIPSFREKYLKDPEGAMKLVNTPEKIREIRELSGEGGDMVGMLQRHFLDNTTTKANGVPLSMEEAGKQLSKPQNQAMIQELYGAEAKTIENLGKVMTILGKREKALSKSASLVGANILSKGVMDAPLTLTRFLAGKYKGKGLVEADKHLVKGIQKEMQKELGMTLEEYAASVKGSQVLPASVDVGKTADELYTSPDGVPTQVEGEAVQADIKTAQDLANEANKGEIAQRSLAQGLDRDLSRQQGRLNKEVTTRFKTKQVSADDKLEYNRILDDIETARNAGDTKKVKETMSELSAFTEHTKNLPNKETSAETATRVAKEKADKAKVARAERKVVEARQEASRASRAQNAERLRRARVAEDGAQAEVNRLAREARQVETDRLAARNQVRSTRTQANDTMVNTLNDKLGGRWEVSESNNGHPRFNDSETGAYFTLHQYSDSMGATTVGLRNGSGAGEKVYHAIFDMAEELGVYYKPDPTLLTANPIRTGMNMLSYMADRGTDANHIMIAPSQRAIGTRGSADYLGNKRLTVENANKLAKNMRNIVKNKLGGRTVTARTTNEEIEQMASITGTDTNMRIGPKSLKLIRKFVRNGQTFKGD